MEKRRALHLSPLQGMSGDREHPPAITARQWEVSRKAKDRGRRGECLSLRNMEICHDEAG